MTTVHDLLQTAILPRLETRMLLEHVLDRPRAWLLAHDTDALDAQQVDAFHELAQRRHNGEPMAYLIGWREFMGHRYLVTPDTLIPRPETELLVQTALERISRLPSARVLDMGTGSGAVAIAIALAAPGANVSATDISAAALKVAQDNAAALGATVEFSQGDWYGAVPRGGSFDLIVSNPPYIACDDAHLLRGDLRFEPRAALTDGATGLGAIQAIASGAARHLKPGGVLWVEHGYDQARAVRLMFEAAALRHVASRRDLAGIERISGGSL